MTMSIRRAFTLDRIDCRVSSDAVTQHSSRVVVLLLLIPILFNAVTLLPELSRPIPSLNDNAVHFLLVQGISRAWASGENLIDHWNPELELGFPIASTYQHLPHLTVVLLHRILLRQFELLTLFNLIRYLLLVGFPLSVYWSMRRIGFSSIAAGVAAASATLISADHHYGFEYDSYIWRGFGMYSQLWAMHLSFLSLGCLIHVMRTGKGYLGAIIAASTLVLSHLLYSFILALTMVASLLVGIRRNNVRLRIMRLLIVAGVSAVITSYFWLPFLLFNPFLGFSPYLQRWKYDSFGAHAILGWLINGDLLDFDRLPVLTALLALGIASAVTRRGHHGALGLVIFGMWLLLFFGRVTWGALADLIPMHKGMLYHRFIGGVNIGAIMLIGLGGEWLWHLLNPAATRWRGAVGVFVLIILLIPPLAERQRFYALNAQWMERTQRALDADADARTILTALRALPPGRTYVGLRANWGKTVQFADLHFYDLLTFYQIPAVSPPYSGFSLNSDMIWHFDDRNPTHYNVFNARYVVAPAGLAMPEFLRPLERTGRYTLYEAQTDGYAGFVNIVKGIRTDSQVTLLDENRRWLQGPDPAAGRFIRYEYPSPDEGYFDAAGPGCPDGGRITEEQILPGRLDLQIECAHAATIAIKTTYHPNWHITIDGRDARPFMVSPSFIGVEVSAGPHRLTAVYRPPWYKTGLLWLGAATLLLTVLVRSRFAGLDARMAGPSRSAGQG